MCSGPHNTSQLTGNLPGDGLPVSSRLCGYEERDSGLAACSQLEPKFPKEGDPAGKPGPRPEGGGGVLVTFKQAVGVLSCLKFSTPESRHTPKPNLSGELILLAAD